MNPKDRQGAKKPNLSVLPFAPLLDVIPALYEGRRKYGPWNWRAEEVSETIYADAAIRHLMQFLAGEDIDPDSGVHHISKAIAGLLVVRDAQIHGCSIDDRYVDQNLNIEKVMEQLATVNEKYPEPVESALPPRDPYDVALKVGESVVAHGDLMVDRFDPNELELGDTLVFSNGEMAEITKLDPECPNGLTICCELCDEEPYFRNDGVIEGGFDPDWADYRIVAAGNQTLVRFTESGKAVSWSMPQAGGGSYRITKDDVGKRVETRDGKTYTIVYWDEFSGWPVQIGSDAEDTLPAFTVTSYGQCSSAIRDAEGFDANEEEDNDIVKVYHS